MTTPSFFIPSTLMTTGEESARDARGRFFHGRLAVQESLVVYPVAQKVIHRKISHAETGQVLEEVCALAGVYTVIRQPGLHNDAGG